MISLSDKKYVKEQYGSSNRLEARIELHKRFSTNKEGWMKWVFARLLTLPGEDVLEVGGGTGALWQENDGKIKKEWKLTFSDQSQAMVKKGMASSALQNCHCTFLQTDVQQLPFADESFDIIIANHMFYHLQDLEAALLETMRVLRKNGRLFATTVGKDHTAELKNMMGQFSPSYECKEAAPTFNLENGEATLSQYFHSVKRFDYVDSFAITESDPLVRYAHSICEDLRLEKFHQYTNELLAKDGVINIVKSSGLFLALAPRCPKSL